MIVVATFKTKDINGNDVFTDTYKKVDTIEQANEILQEFLDRDELYSASICGVIKSTDYTPTMVNSRVDYKKLRKQKEILGYMLQDWGEADDKQQRKDASIADGLITLIDHIQDEAVSFGWVSEKKAFGK